MELHLHISGEPAGSGPVKDLLAAIEACEQAWGEDPAYKKVRFWLDKVEQELDVICASPGHRAALRSLPPNSAGQEPEERTEFT